MSGLPVPQHILSPRSVMAEIMNRSGPVQRDSAWAVPLVVVATGLFYVVAYLFVADEFPFDVGRDIGYRLDVWLDWLKDNLGPLFQAIKDVIVWFLISLEDMMLWFTWPASIAAIALVSWLLVSTRMALFSASSLLLLATFGLWESTVETMALIIVTVTLSIMIAVPLGVWASQSDRLDAVLRPMLDAMQTMPSFVYLVPAIAFFSLGNTPAVLATLIYAVPPAVRLTNLGIRQLPAETLEAADSFGMTRRQMLLKVKIPLAIPTIMAGVNQTTLMALSMVVIASLVGAGGLGLDVNRALGRIEPGNGFLAGLGIVFVAIIIDRITQALTKKQQDALGSE
ncbi:MAG: ABC transporter permease subunit [Chloroflexi bacterium]|nr:ABC transporter permease subunit [Chloroflexota bacterium]